MSDTKHTPKAAFIASTMMRNAIEYGRTGQTPFRDNANLATDALLTFYDRMLAALKQARAEWNQDQFNTPTNLLLQLDSAIEAAEGHGEMLRAVYEADATIEALRYYVNNPSAWKSYDDALSEKMRAVADLAYNNNAKVGSLLATLSMIEKGNNLMGVQALAHSALASDDKGKDHK